MMDTTPMLQPCIVCKAPVDLLKFGPICPKCSSVLTRQERRRAMRALEKGLRKYRKGT